MRRASRHPIHALLCLTLCAAGLTSTVCAVKGQDVAVNESVAQLAEALANDIITDTIKAGAAEVAASRPVVHCNTPAPPPNVTAAAFAKLTKQKQKETPLLGAAHTESSSIEIEIVFHVLSSGKSVVHGNIPDSWIAAQIARLNAGYDAAGFTFALIRTTRNINASWFGATLTSQQEYEFKAALGVRNPRVLNLYSGKFLDQTGGNVLLGWATYPWDVADLPQRDGVCLFYESLPGGDASYGSGAVYNRGGTAVHEVGHWLGLLHPFQGGCTVPNDGILDTPEASDAANYIYNCNNEQDSCPTSPGLDPVHNYMAYTDDACMNNFTPDQIAQMQAAFAAYRHPNPPPPPLPPTHSVRVPTKPASKPPTVQPAERPSGTSKPAPVSAEPPATAAQAQVRPCEIRLPPYAQCGGQGGSCAGLGCADAPFTGACCPAATSTCARANSYYWQCL